MTAGDRSGGGWGAGIEEERREEGNDPDDSDERSDFAGGCHGGCVLLSFVLLSGSVLWQ